MTKSTAAVIVSVLVSLAALVAWLRYEFSPSTAAIALLALFGVIVFAAGSVLSLATQRATLNAIVDFQAADDRGEVERFRTMREYIKGQNKLAAQDNQHQWRIADEQRKQLPPATDYDFRLPEAYLGADNDDSEVYIER